MAVPTDVASLESWYKADAITGLTNGAASPTWADSSGNGLDAASASTNKPVYKTNAVNGLPVLGFGAGGPASSLSSNSSTSLAATTIFSVVKPLLSGSLSIRGCATGGLQFRIQTGKADLLKAGVADLGSGATTVSTAAFSVVTGAFANAAAWSVYVNGALDGGATTGVSVSTGLTAIIGGSGTGGSEVFYGDIAELIVYSSVLSSTDRDAIHTYLATKYAITLTVAGKTASVDTRSQRIRPLIVR